MTISLGVATEIPQENNLPQDLIVNADQALYQAKHRGRNRIAVHQEVAQEVAVEASCLTSELALERN